MAIPPTNPQDIETAVAVNAAHSRWKRYIRIFERLLTFAAACGVLVVGWSTVQGFSKLLTPSGSRTDIVDRSPALNPASIEPFERLREPGYWQMAGWNWQAGFETVPSDQLESRFGAAARLATSQEVMSAEVGQLDSLLNVAKGYEFSKKRIEDGTIYYTESEGLRLQIVTRRNSGSETVRGLAIALPHGASSNWMLFALLPRGPHRESGGSEMALPMPNDVTELGRRIDEQRRVQLRLMSLDATPAELTTFWREDGWQVRRETFGEIGRVAWTCQKGEAEFVVYSPQNSNRVRSLIVVRTGI